MEILGEPPRAPHLRGETSYQPTCSVRPNIASNPLGAMFDFNPLYLYLPCGPATLSLSSPAGPLTRLIPSIPTGGDDDDR